ncbi:MAG: hypothetical protein P8N09_10360 [Planctomycetota bacterium]|jgi:hypothetical protein|nr:hypothetical protein [Planctomycetota bacterium]
MRTHPIARHIQTNCTSGLPLVVLAVLFSLPTCGQANEPSTTGATGTLQAAVGRLPGHAPKAADDTPDKKLPKDAVSFKRLAYKPGDRFVARTRLELKLNARLGVGFLGQEVTYRREEEEVLAVTILPEEDGDLRRSLEFKQRRTSTTLPIVGKETEDRRVAGKTLTVTTKGNEHTIYNKSGREVNEKVAKEAGYSLRILGRQPVFFAVLPPGEEAYAIPGKTIEVQGEDARRIVGLPFEELGVDSLQLTLRPLDKKDSAVAIFDANASFSGSTIVGDSQLQLTASLSGEVVVMRNTMRMASVELSGHVDAQHEPTPGSDEGLLSATGSGPLVIRRKITDS